MGWAQRTKAGRAGDRPLAESKYVPQLRELAARIETRQQFEDMALTARDPGTFKLMVEPMLRPDLPCCGRGWDEPHHKRCSSQKPAESAPLLVTPEGEAARAAGVAFDSSGDGAAFTGLVGPDGRPLHG